MRRTRMTYGCRGSRGVWSPEAGQRGNLAALECLRRLGVPWSEGLLLKAVAGGVPVPVFQWLRGQGASRTWRRPTAWRLRIGTRIANGE